MVYMLGYRPDEFGLVPDPEGYIPYKNLLQAIHEEPGWGYVRQGHFNEILMGWEQRNAQTKTINSNSNHLLTDTLQPQITLLDRK